MIARDNREAFLSECFAKNRYGKSEKFKTTVVFQKWYQISWEWQMNVLAVLYRIVIGMATSLNKEASDRWFVANYILWENYDIEIVMLCAIVAVFVFYLNWTFAFEKYVERICEKSISEQLVVVY
jgi:hypothetical protein